MKQNHAAQAERLERAALSAQSAQKIRIVLEDNAITGALDAIEKAMIEEMIKAQDSDKRDRCAAEITAMRKVRGLLTQMAFQGARSERVLQAS